MILKFKVLFFSCVIFISSYANFEQFILKVNVVKGEKFVTAKIDAEALDSKLEKYFIEKGLERITDQSNNFSLIYIDLFVYQFTGDFPSMAIAARTKRGIHYFDNNKKSFFTNRTVATEKILDELISKIPEKINSNFVYDIKLDNILFQRRSDYHVEIANQLILSNFLIKVNWNDLDPLDFIVEDALKNYLSNCINLQGSKNKLKGKYIVLTLKVNESGATEVSKSHFPFKIKERNKEKLFTAIEALPTFITDDFVREFVVTIGM